MTRNCRRFLCFVLAALMLAALLPTSLTGSSALAEGSHGKTIKDAVNFRVGPSMKDKMLFRLPLNTICTVLGQVTANGYSWYKAEARDPANAGGVAQTGYIRSDCFRPLTAEEEAAYSGSTVTAEPVITAAPTAAPSNPDALGYVMTIKGSVNIRASIGGTSLTTVGKYKTMPYLLTPVKRGNYTWYFVQVNSTLKGYVRSDCVKVVSGPGGDTTPVTAAPVVTATPQPTSPTGYLKTRIDAVNVRTGVWGNLVTVVQKAGTVFPYYGEPKVDRNGVKWYYIYSPSFGYAYIHGGYITLTDDGGSSVVTPTPTPVSPVTAEPVITATPTPAVTSAPSQPLGYVKTTASEVNVRADAWGTKIGVIKKSGTVLPYYSIKNASGNDWYYIYSPDFGYGYILGKFLKVTEDGGSAATPTPTPVSPVTAVPVVTATPSPTPAVTAAPSEPLGYLKTTTSDVNVRTDAWGKLITTVKKSGTVFPYYSFKEVSGNKWYYIYSPDFGYGYILGKFVKLTDESGGNITPSPTPEPTPTAEPTATPEPGTTPAPGFVTEASYTTLKSGSSGPAVQNLVAELINQGYYKYSLTSSYTSSVETAVREFQRANGLAIDGIAGEKTQHALFHTVPIGTADHTNLTMTLYPAEKIDWNTGGINELWAKGSNLKVYDVYTGLVWWAHRWSGGLHVDAEPLTAADTATLCKIYGVKKASDIKESTHWQRRPCLITIGTRTFACSLYGVPHNEDGDTIKDNNFVGQLCIHFTNSKIHKSGRVDSKHEEAIEYAWTNAPNGHK